MRHQGVFDAMGFGFSYDAWLNAPAIQIEAEEERSEWIENRAHQMMQTGEDFDPYTPDNIAQALEALRYSPEFLADLALYLPMVGVLAETGNLVKSAIHAYHYKAALKQAKLEYNGEFCNEN